MTASIPTGAAPRAAHRPSAREAMLAAAEELLGADGTLTLDSAARAAGVTKAGLMYHFATKEALLDGVLERIATGYEREMLARIRAHHGTWQELADVPAALRHLAYLEWAATGELSAADLVIVADPRLRVALTGRWREQLERWLAVPAEITGAQRAHLLAVRLMADGLWFDRASGLLEMTEDQAEPLLAHARELIGGEA